MRSHLTYRSVVYRYRGRTELSEVSRVPVLNYYQTHRSVGYRYRVRNEVTELSGGVVDFVPNHTGVNHAGVFRRILRPCRTNTGTPSIVAKGIRFPGVYLSACTELTKVSSTGIEAVPNLTEKCRAPVSRPQRFFFFFVQNAHRQHSRNQFF